MERYQVIIAYDGTLYEGFQRQIQSPTVQLAIEDALRRLSWCGKSVLAAGRTDSGVHATGQVIAFDLDWRHSDTALR
ncbi:MAG: tRNA pseudouridine(38-40) synthase TruA, partial [Anaerolineales bacterium]|nr:tRNA pseudouridine(38-40) synthase TruA [Anaerolineales bacterium]